MVDEHLCSEGEQIDVVTGAGQFGVFPFSGDSYLLGYRYKRSGTCEVGVDRTLKRGANSLFKDAHCHRNEPVTVKNKCERQVGQVYSVALVIVAGSDEESDMVGSGHDEEGVPIQTHRRIGFGSLQSEDWSMGKVVLEKGTATFRDRLCGGENLKSYKVGDGGSSYPGICSPFRLRFR